MDNNSNLNIWSKEEIASIKAEISANASVSNTTFDWSSPYSAALIVPVSLIMVLLSLVTIFGNLMVLLSFYIDKKIREPSNYFIFSLALSDFMIGLEGFPLYSIYVLHGQKWTMGWFMCDLWLSIDYAVCLASIYTVLFITIDRFCSVKIPTTYRNWRTKRRISIIVIIIWIIPTLLFFVSVFGWEHFSGDGRILQSHECEVQFMKNPYFNMSMYISYYWSTLIVMIVLYAGIYQAARRLQMKSHQKQRRLTAAAAMQANVASVGVCLAPLTSLTIQSPNNHPFQPSFDDSLSQLNSVQKLVSKDGTEYSKTSSTRSSDLTGNVDAMVRFHEDLRKTHDCENELLPIISLSLLHDKKMLDQIKRKKYGRFYSAAESFRTFYLKTSDSVLKRVPKKVYFDKSKKTYVKKSKSLEHPKRTSARDRISSSQLEKIFEEEIPEANTSFHNNVHIFKNLSADDKFESFDNQCMYLNDQIESGDSNCAIFKRPSFERSPIELRNSNSDVVGYIDIDSECFSLNEEESPPPKNEASSCSRNSSPFVSLLEDLYGADVSGDYITLAMQQAVSSLCTLAPKDDSNTYNEEQNKEKSSTPNAPHSLSDDQQQELPGYTIGVKKGETVKKSADTSTPLLTKAVSFDRGSEIFDDDDDNSSIGRKDSGDETVGKEIASGKQSTILNSLKSFQTNANGKSKLYSLLKIKRSGSRMYKKSKSENRARKALRTITIILGAFVLFWTPFYVLATMYGFCNECIPSWLFITSYYMCYMNSPINPFCYAMANAQFKKTFSRMLRGDFHRA